MPDKYTELKTFKLEVNNVLSTYSMPEAEKLAVAKNWLGRKELHYVETLMPAEREACTMLDGLHDTLATKLKLQYNETIKSLQFRKLVWLESKNVEEWMGRLHVAAVECNYREIDRQLKEQFIHGLNDKCMLEEIIKELTITRDDDQITSKSVLAWAKRVNAQRAQAAVLNTIMELRQFDKVKVVKKPREDSTRHPLDLMAQWHPCRYCGRIHMLRQCPAYGKMCVGCGKTRHFKKVCQSRRDREGKGAGNQGVTRVQQRQD